MQDRRAPFAQRRRRLIKDLGSKALWSFERTIATYSRVDDGPLVDRRFFPWIDDLERHALSMRRELDALLVHREALPSFQEISPDQRSITNDDRWKTYFLYGFGKKSEANCARCPITAAVLSSIPHLTTAFFSILSPGKHIPRHRGVYKGVVRAHLGLKVPEQTTACRMEIAGNTLHWREGEAFMFDDTYEHEVWNDSDGERVVLLVDVLRPLPLPVHLLNRALVRAVAASPFVKDGEKNERAWERRFEEVLRRAGGPPDANPAGTAA